MSIPTPNEKEKGEGRKSLAASIQGKLLSLPKRSESCCIYRVPKHLRQVNEKAYTPLFVSIGPFHYKNNEELLPMEPHKLRCLQSFLQAPSTNGDINSYLQLIKDKESQIRDSYAEPITLSSDELISMVLVDTAFIFQLLLRWMPIIKPIPKYLFITDLLLAENQLPFFILKDLYKHAFNNNLPGGYYLTDIACMCLKVERSKIEVDHTTREAECWHLLDLLRTHHLPTCNQHVISDADVYETCPTATSLYEAGVKFQLGSTSSSDLLHIQFDKENGILTIPKLIFHDSTETSVRNLIAFEQCHYLLSHEPNSNLTQYYSFMDKLIDTKEDVKLLVKAGIIQNLMGSEMEVSNLINSLCNHVSCVHPSFLSITHKQLNAHCNKKWNHYMGTLNNVYLKHPWAVTSIIVASILLFLTVVQVVTGILAVPGVLK